VEGRGRGGEGKGKGADDDNAAGEIIRAPKVGRRGREGEGGGRRQPEKVRTTTTDRRRQTDDAIFQKHPPVASRSVASRGGTHSGQRDGETGNALRRLEGRYALWASFCAP